MVNLTKKEAEILKIVEDICLEDYCANMKNIQSLCSYSIETIQGVLETLIQKGHIQTGIRSTQWEKI